MSGFRFPLEPSPALGEPTTPMQTHTKRANGKENDSEVSLTHKLVTSAACEPVTPDLFKKPLRVVQSAPPEDDLPTAYDLISWKNPPASFCALVGGECLLFGAHWCFGLGRTTFVSGLCNVLLLCLTANFIRSCFSERWLLSSRWRGSDLERVLMQRTNDIVSFVMLLRDESVCAINPSSMLKTALVLSAVNVVGSYVSFWALAMLGWAALFIGPVTNKHLGASIGALYGKAVAAAQEPWKKLKLSRAAKLSALGAVLAATVIFSTWTFRASLLLIFMILVRCNIKASEMRYFREHQVTRAVQNNALVRSAFKATTRVTSFADDVLASAMKSARRAVAGRSSEREE